MTTAFDAFDLGITWQAFGDLDRSGLDALMGYKSFNPVERAKLVSMWKRHPILIYSSACNLFLSIKYLQMKFCVAFCLNWNELHLSQLYFVSCDYSQFPQAALSHVIDLKRW